MARLGDICTFYSGTGFPIEMQGRTSGIYPFYKVSDISSNTANGNYRLITCNNYVNAEDVDKIKGTLLPPGTVVFAKIGEAVKLNRRAITEQTCLVDNNVMGIQPDKGEIDLKYFYYFMCNLQLEKFAESTTVPSVRKSIIENITMQVPTIEIQRNMAFLLDSVCRLISLRKQQLQKLDELVKARFVEMFGDPHANPYGWEQVTVSDVCSSIVRGPFGSALKKEFFVEPNETTYKVYEQKHAIQKSAAIGTYYITAEKYSELRRFECRPGDILMSCSGTMGELFQLPPNCERGIINQALCKFTLNDRMLPVAFLAYMKETIGHLETKGSGIQNIAAVSYVKAMPINLPPMHIQQQFAAFVEQKDNAKLTIQQGLDKLELLKKTLMFKCFQYELGEETENG